MFVKLIKIKLSEIKSFLKLSYNSKKCNEIWNLINYNKNNNINNECNNIEQVIENVLKILVEE